MDIGFTKTVLLLTGLCLIIGIILIWDAIDSYKNKKKLK